MSDLLNATGSEDQKFAILRDAEASTVMGGDACSYLNNCGTYSGNDGSCPNLVSCNNYKLT